MLLVFAITFLLKHYDTLAAPLPIPESLHDASDASVFIRDDSLVSDSCRRRVLNIIWSCLATTFACTWISVNVPSKGEGYMTLLRRRVLLMFLSILAPEVMVLWAFKQWRGAVMIRESVNYALPFGQLDKRWTTAHGHLLQMGGFRLRTTMRENLFFDGCTAPSVVRDEALLSSGTLHQRSNRSYTTWNVYERTQGEAGQRDSEDNNILQGVLTIEAFKCLLRENLIHFPTITEDEINDRSKGDALSKGFALLQFTWFIVQIIARSTHSLAITELELTTAAINGLNCATCFFWWSKPRDMRIPVVIQTKGVEELLAKRTEEFAWHFSDRRYRDGVSILGYFLRSIPMRTLSVFLRLFKTAKFFPRQIALSFSQVKRNPFRRRATAEAVGNISSMRSGDMRSPCNAMPSIEDRSHTKSYLQTLVKSALKFAALPIFFILYLADLVIFIPIGSISSGGPTLSLSMAFNLGLDTGADTETFKIMFYSEDMGVKPLINTYSVAGALLGVVHCLAWKFAFPTHIEQVIWRAASLVVVGTCAATFCSVICAKLESCYDSFVAYHLSRLWTALVIPLSIIYTAARITLFILAVTSLRILPSSAFDTIDWVELVPHI